MIKRSFVASLTKVRREVGRGVGMVGVYKRRDPVLSDPRLLLDIALDVFVSKRRREVE